jgi:hypothetical protein
MIKLNVVLKAPDLGSRIPNPYFWEIINNFLVKKYELQKLKNFVKFVATKKVKKLIFSPSFYAAVVGFGIRDQMNKNRDRR